MLEVALFLFYFLVACLVVGCKEHQVSAPVPVAIPVLPDGWNLSKSGKPLTGAVLQARMKRYGLL